MYHIIINPASRSGKGLQIWKRQVEPALQRGNVPYRPYFSEKAGDVARIASEIISLPAQSPVSIVILGGDGTMNEALQGIPEQAQVILGYIPTGSSNDLARDLNIPTDPTAALDLILHTGKPHAMDLGVLTYSDGEVRRFAVSCGIGFDAAVCHEAIASHIKDTLNKFRLGKLTYVGIALKQILFFRPFPMTALLDNGNKLKFSRTYFVSALNCSYEGGGLKLCPKAKAGDGFLDLCVVEGLSKLTIALMFPTAYIGRHTIFRGVRLYRTRSLEIRTDKPLPFHTDGEPEYLRGTIRISCLPSCLTLISGNGNLIDNSAKFS